MPVALFLAALAIAPWTGALATSCSDGRGDPKIVGRLTSLDGATATFRVESSTPGKYRPQDTPLPKTGTNAAVFFYSGSAQFLREGQRYVVPVGWSEGRYSSWVDTAQDPCGGGTRHADGTTIETSLLSRPHVRKVLLVTVVVPAATLLILALWLRHRDQLRKRRNDASLRSAAG